MTRVERRAALENQLSSHRPGLSHLKDRTVGQYMALLLMVLKIAFRQSKFDVSALSARGTPHHERMFDLLADGTGGLVLSLLVLSVGRIFVPVRPSAA